MNHTEEREVRFKISWSKVADPRPNITSPVWALRVTRFDQYGNEMHGYDEHAELVIDHPVRKFDREFELMKACDKSARGWPQIGDTDTSGNVVVALNTGAMTYRVNDHNSKDIPFSEFKLA